MSKNWRKLKRINSSRVRCCFSRKSTPYFVRKTQLSILLKTLSSLDCQNSMAKFILRSLSLSPSWPLMKNLSSYCISGSSATISMSSWTFRSSKLKTLGWHWDGAVQTNLTKLMIKIIISAFKRHSPRSRHRKPLSLLLMKPTGMTNALKNRLMSSVLTW